MAQRVTEIMTDRIISVELSNSAADAARVMRDEDVGDVLVTENNIVRGVVTDRDIVVRVVSHGSDASTTSVRDVKSNRVVSVAPDTPVDEAIQTLRENALRRLPVIDGEGHALGVVALGDLAADRDPGSALSDITSAPGNE